MRYCIFLIGLVLLTCTACSDNGTPPEVGSGEKPLMTALIDSKIFYGESMNVDLPQIQSPNPRIFCSNPDGEAFFELNMTYDGIQAEGTYPTDFCTLDFGYKVYEQSNSGGSITFSKIGDDLVEGIFSVTLIDLVTQSESLMTGSFTGDPFLPGEFLVIFEFNAESHTCENSWLFLHRTMRFICVKDDDYYDGEAAQINIEVFSIDQSWIGDYDFNRSDTEARVTIGLVDSENFLATGGQLTVSSMDSIPIYAGEEIVGYHYVIGTGSFHFTASSNEVPPKMITVTDGFVNINGLD